VKQEKDNIFALMQSSTTRESLKNNISSNWSTYSPLKKEQQEEKEEEQIVFSDLAEDDEDSERSKKDTDGTEPMTEATKIVDASVTCINESPPSPSSPLSPPSEDEGDDSNLQSEQQRVKSKAISSVPKKRKKLPPVFGLEVVTESALEESEVGSDDDEEEETSEGPRQQPEQETAADALRTNASQTFSGKQCRFGQNPHAVNVTVHEVESFKDQKGIWWNGSEFQNIKQCVNETVRFCKAYNRNHVELLEDIMRCDCLEDEDLMNNLLKDLLSTSIASSGFSSSPSSFLRGLEGHLSKHINKHRKRHNRKVLNAQEVACNSDKTLEETWEILRDESMERSQPLQAFARRMGQFDEMVAANAQKTRASLWDI